MADAAPTHADVFDAVEILEGSNQENFNQKLKKRLRRVVSTPHPARDRRIPLGLGDQVAQQRVGAKEVQADVGGLGEVLQHRRVGEPFGAGPAVDQGHHNLNTRIYFTRGRCVFV